MRYILIILFLIISNCSTNKVVNNHGISALEKKSDKIIVNESNINDISEILGPPSTKSTFDENIWIYIERKKTNTSIFMLGNQKTEKHYVAVLEIDNRGILKKKEIFDLDDMNKHKFSQSKTNISHRKDTYLYGVLTSLREKINAPTKRKKVNK